MEENGYVSIPAAGFHRKFESNDIKMNILPGVGVEGLSLIHIYFVFQSYHPPASNRLLSFASHPTKQHVLLPVSYTHLYAMDNGYPRINL